MFYDEVSCLISESLFSSFLFIILSYYVFNILTVLLTYGVIFFIPGTFVKFLRPVPRKITDLCIIFHSLWLTSWMSNNRTLASLDHTY